MTARCKDCGPDSKRPAPHPGPRCATHHREKRKASQERNHGTYLKRTYNMTAEQYSALLAFQGGVCYVCQRANGKTRRLSVDHDHKCCPKPPTCGKCTRGLLCRPCNDLFGHVRDDVDTLNRARWYLLWPPYRRMP